MTVKLLIEHHLEFLSLKGGGTGCSEPTLVKMPHCWESHVMAFLAINAILSSEPLKVSEYDQIMPQSHTTYHIPAGT